MDSQKTDNESLLKLVRAGDKKARDEVIIKNLALVQHVVNRVTKCLRYQEKEDVFQCGVMGLIKAVDAYKFGKTQFHSFAFICIKNEIFMYFRQLRKHKNVVSLFDNVPDVHNKELTHFDRLKSPDDVEKEVEKTDALGQIKKIVDCKLTEAQKSILTERYFTKIDKSQIEIAQDLGFSQSYCSRMEKKALQTIREEMSKAEKV